MNTFLPIRRLLTLLTALVLLSCGSNPTQAQPQTDNTMTQKLILTVGNETMTATLADNNATQALVAALAESPITYEADDYGGFEKVGALGRTLPTSNQQLTTEAGDIILYNGNQIVLFYGSNTWSYTRLGRIDYDTLDRLKAFLHAGQGRISVTLSLADTSDIRDAEAGEDESAYVSINGTRTAKPDKGVYIHKGRKIRK